MKTIAPNYYKEFKCIADKCLHSCCIGWEIDIDNDTYIQYKKVDTEFGKKLEKNIEHNGEYSQFKLLENQRCPFLNDSNLCDIIINLGEDALCQICRDHPRFRNYYSDRVEIGLGLCCEEASRIIINNENPFKLIKFDEDAEPEVSYDDELEFFNLREKIFEIIQSEKDFKTVTDKILCLFNFTFPQKTLSQWAKIYLNLEILNDYWGELLNKLKDKDCPSPFVFRSYNHALKNLLTYFIYRHLGESIYDENFKGRLLFAILSCYIISALSEFELNIEEIAVMYSSEIEYSDENLNALIEFLQKVSPES